MREQMQCFTEPSDISGIHFKTQPAAAPPPLKPTGARSRRGAAIPTNDCRGGAPSPLSAMLTDFLLVCSTVLKQAAAEPASRHLTAAQIESCPSNTNLYKCAEWAIRRLCIFLQHLVCHFVATGGASHGLPRGHHDRAVAPCALVRPSPPAGAVSQQ